MSNPLSVRRVKIQTIDRDGNPVGKPSYGILASDNEVTAFNDTFETRESLESAIHHADSILGVVDPNEDVFTDPIHEKIGKDNFYGKDWF